METNLGGFDKFEKKLAPVSLTYLISPCSVGIHILSEAELEAGPSLSDCK
jgi:hypothetical protein